MTVHADSAASDRFDGYRLGCQILARYPWRTCPGIHRVAVGPQGLHVLPDLVRIAKYTVCVILSFKDNRIAALFCSLASRACHRASRSARSTSCVCCTRCPVWAICACHPRTAWKSSNTTGVINGASGSMTNGVSACVLTRAMHTMLKWRTIIEVAAHEHSHAKLRKHRLFGRDRAPAQAPRTACSPRGFGG